jgi:opacity protein-like surface antigen
MRGMTIFAITAFAAMASSPAAAQVRMTEQGSGRPISFAFGGGASVPVGSYKDALKAGWNGQGSVIFHFAGLPLSLRADLSYNHFTFKDDLPFSSGGTGTSTDDITQQILGGLANVSIPFRMGPVSPYITAGLAGFNIKTNLGDVVPGAQDESATKFAVNGGVGLSMKLFGASAFVEAKVNNIYTDGKVVGSKELKDLQFVPVTFGFVF